MKALEKADPGTVDAAYSLCARVERVESPWVRGFMFLVQTTQEESGDLPNNHELTYVRLHGRNYRFGSRLMFARDTITSFFA
jgi:hypothetical protein